MWRYLCLVTTAWALAPPKINLGDYLVQRAVQQQLNYMADLKNEPLGNWLKAFQDHAHLDSNSPRRFPGTYSAAFGQLNKPYTDYLVDMGTAEKEIVEIAVAPRRRLSARELANPFLAKQAMEIYEEVIDPQQVLLRLVTTADVMVDTWAFQFEELEKADQERVALERQIGGLPDAAMLRDAELAEGGETRTSWYTEDEPMPLYAFDQRACDRLATLRALEALTEEVRQLTPQNAFESGYLRREAKADEDDDDVDARVVERRRKRRAEREARYVKGEGDEIASAAKEAALAFLEEFCQRWVPKLSKGDPRSSLEKRSKRPPPGQYESRPRDAGADADAMMEALWAYRDESPYHIRGGELVIPARMALRLRELRVEAAAAARRELAEDIHPQLLEARAKYTDYVEPVAEEVVATGDDGWD
jgi:hypothetical protein